MTASDDLSARLLGGLGVEGVLILGVVPRSAADRAGLKATQAMPGGSIVLGDVIQAIDGREIDTFEQLSGRLDEYSVGDPVTLTLWRNGETVETRLELQAPSP